MSEATANSKQRKEIKVSNIILPENKNYESESLKSEIEIPNWLLEKISNSNGMDYIGLPTCS